ncbi:MAG: DUF86 domain-containing protein [Acidobacteria bacterium]|nr:MAG: DUF86 domain-containing protein [Acidobacteriota bacterium]
MTPGVEANRPTILRIAASYGAHNVRVFGSEARGEARGDSDLDLLVDMEPGRSLLDLVGLGQDLEDLLGRRVDVVTERSLLRDRMRQDAVVRKLEIIGEAVKQLSERSTSREPDVPWRKIAGLCQQVY